MTMVLGETIWWKWIHDGPNLLKFILHCKYSPHTPSQLLVLLHTMAPRSLVYGIWKTKECI